MSAVEGAGGSLTIRLLTGDAFVFAPLEFPRAILHRYLLPFYLACMAFTTLLDNRLARIEIAVTDRLVLGMISSAAALVVVAVVLVRLERAALAGRAVVLRQTPLLLGATLASVLAGDAAMLWLVAEVEVTAGRALALWGFYYVIGEVFVTLLHYHAFPRALRDLRAGQRAARDGAGPEDAAPGEAAVLIGGHRIALATLRRLSADGNYVVVETVRGRHYLPGPFGPVVDALPVALGQRVTRSDWVALAAVEGLREADGMLVLDLAGAESLPVARARRKAVEAWLRAAGRLDQSDGSARSTQSG